MKSALLVSSSALLVLIASCAPQEATIPAGTGGRSATSGGATGSGGDSASGGAIGSGGDTGSGGAIASGGATGTGGAQATGGSTGTGGRSSNGGTGEGTGGGTNTGGSTGSGGATGTGGRGTGGAGTGGAGTGGAATGGSMGGTAIVGAFDGYLFTARCGDGGTGFDCLNYMCTPKASGGQEKTVTREFTIAGTTGTVYNVTFNVRGVVEAKNYSGGTRRAGTTLNYGDMADFWHTGGTIPTSTYNTYELHVTPAVPGEANSYYLNSRGGSSEGHQSWKLGYSATIKVPANGKITFRSYDSNCRMIMNCGPGAGSSTCMMPNSIDLSTASPQPTGFTQPYVGGAPNNATGQWVFIDVTAVTPV